MDNQFILVITTVSNREEGEALASALVQQRLVACVNISSSVTSIYHWQGKVCKDEEFTLFMKTKKALYQRLEAKIRMLHSYDLPEVIAIPIESGSREYLSWVSENTQALDEQP